MGETHAVTPAYFPLFARLSTLPANATVSPVILTRQLKQLVPIQYQWYQAQLRTQAIQTDTSQVVTIPEYMFTDQEVAAINTYLENNPPNEERLNTNPIVTGVVDFFFGDFITLADPEASLGEKALATTFILVKPAKVGEVVYDLSKARKVKTGGKGNGNIVREVKEVDFGKHIVKGENGKKQLLPNTKYVTNNDYKYTTDELGRIVNVEAHELVLKKADRNKYAQANVGGKDRLPDDDGGHLIGAQFNGPGDIDNLVPQNSQINRRGGVWYEMETEWADALRDVPPKKGLC